MKEDQLSTILISGILKKKALTRPAQMSDELPILSSWCKRVSFLIQKEER
jgi:hypothetical protein